MVLPVSLLPLQPPSSLSLYHQSLLACQGIELSVPNTAASNPTHLCGQLDPTNNHLKNGTYNPPDAVITESSYS